MSVSVPGQARREPDEGLTPAGEACIRIDPSREHPRELATDMTRSPSNDPPDDEGPDEDTVKAIVDASEARVFRIDPSMRMTWANRAARERHGLGQRATATLAEVFDAPKRAALLRPLRRALAGSRESIEWRSVDEQDRPCWTLATITPELDADGRVRSCVVVCVDATEQHRLSDARQRGDAQKRSVLENLPDLVWTMRADGSPDWFNHRWSEYGGRPTSEWTDLMPPEDQARARAAWEEAQRDPVPFTLEARLQRDDGALRWHLLRILPLRESVTDPTVWGWCGSGTDIDDRKKAEVALRSTQDRVGSFLGSLSHELRNPLAALAAAVQIMRHPRAAPGMVARALDTIERQTGQLSRLVDELLDVTRLMDGRIDLQYSEVALDELVRETCEDLAARAAADGVALGCELPSQPVFAQVDPVRIRQALANLVVNALHACRETGSVTVSVLDLDATEVGIRVTDSGCGLTSERLAALLDSGPGPLPGSHRSGGFGLGLQTARHIATLHGGRLVASSAGSGHGATFELRFPPRREMPAARESDPAPADLRGHVVLLIGELGHAQFAAQLEQRGAVVGVARAGIEGLRLLAQGTPTALVCDLDLPAPLTGYDVLREVDRIGALPRPRMIAIGASEEIDIAAAKAAGFDDCLIRPVTTARLLEALSAASPRIGA